MFPVPFDVHEFADALGQAPIAAKTAVVQAFQVTSGGTISTVLAGGFVETTNVYSPGDWVLTNPGGEQYVMSDSQFETRYVPHQNPGWFAPRWQIRAVQYVGDDTIEILAPWGEPMVGQPGCFIAEVIPDTSDLTQRSTDRYLIDEQAFQDTYAWLHGPRHLVAAPTAELGLPA